MREIDDLLGGLRSVASDPRLMTMDDAVMAGVAARQAQKAGRRGVLLTSLMALGIGFTASLLSPHGAQAGEMAQLNAVPLNAPSNLLMGVR